MKCESSLQVRASQIEVYQIPSKCPPTRCTMENVKVPSLLGCSPHTSTLCFHRTSETCNALLAKVRAYPDISNKNGLWKDHQHPPDKLCLQIMLCLGAHAIPHPLAPQKHLVSSYSVYFHVFSTLGCYSGRIAEQVSKDIRLPIPAASCKACEICGRVGWHILAYGIFFWISQTGRGLVVFQNTSSSGKDQNLKICHTQSSPQALWDCQINFMVWQGNFI